MPGRTDRRHGPILLIEIIRVIAPTPEMFGASLLEIPVFKKICDLAINYIISKAMEAILD